MICRVLWIPLLFSLGLQIPAAGQQKPASTPSAEQKAKEDPLSRFHWLADSSDTRGMVLETAKLSAVKIDPRQETSAEIETEIARPNASSMRITRHVYDRGAGGERQLVEVVVEDVRVTAGDGVSATRTVSRPDINGRMTVARKETQETVPIGAGAYRTRARRRGRTSWVETRFLDDHGALLANALTTLKEVQEKAPLSSAKPGDVRHDVNKAGGG